MIYTSKQNSNAPFFVVVVSLHLGLVFSGPSVRTGRVLRALRRTWLPSASKLLDGLIRQSRSWDHDRPHPSSLQFCVLCVACSWEQVCSFDRKLYFKNEGEIGPNKLLQRLLDILPGTGKKWPIADRRVSSDNPRNNFGTHFGSSSLLGFKAANSVPVHLLQFTFNQFWR